MMTISSLAIHLYQYTEIYYDHGYPYNLQVLMSD